jgi:hypothetical protein
MIAEFTEIYSLNHLRRKSYSGKDEKIFNYRIAENLFKDCVRCSHDDDADAWLSP